MKDRLSIEATTQEYLARYPAEKARLEPFLEFLRLTPPSEYAARTNLFGHITTSGFLVSETGDAVLLIYHLKLQRYLQPGGHVEEDASLLASASREIREEVGLSGDSIALCQQDECPMDIDPHRIPARGDLPEHWHFDFRYLFTVKAGAVIEHQIEEVARPAWFGWDAPEVREILPAPVIERLRFCKSLAVNTENLITEISPV